jgi:acetyl esterase/lipase
MKKLAVIAGICAVALAQGQRKPAPLPEGVEKKADVVYATRGARQMRLDLYLPKQSGAPMPAVVYIHGGGWKNGSKNAFSGQAGYMATRGFVGACIEYRLSGEAKYPAALDDSVAAVKWLREHAREYNIDPKRIGAAGGSAGGHLVALLGTMKPPVVQAVAAFNPAVDLVSFGKGAPADAASAVTEFLGATYESNPKLWAEATPLTHAGKGSAPFLFLHGDADTTVPFQQSLDMLAKLKAAGVPADLFTAKGAKHGFFNQDPWYEPTKKRMEEFFLKYLAPRTS